MRHVLTLCLAMGLVFLPAPQQQPGWPLQVPGLGSRDPLGSLAAQNR